MGEEGEIDGKAEKKIWGSLILAITSFLGGHVSSVQKMMRVTSNIETLHFLHYTFRRSVTLCRLFM